jgi:hypothetical protein
LRDAAGSGIPQVEAVNVSCLLLGDGSGDSASGGADLRKAQRTVVGSSTEKAAIDLGRH